MGHDQVAKHEDADAIRYALTAPSSATTLAQPWYIRVRSLILLILIVIGLGMAIAGVTLLVLASGRFVIEILAS